MISLKTDRAAVQRFGVRMAIAGTLAIAAAVTTRNWLETQGAAAAQPPAAAVIIAPPAPGGAFDSPGGAFDSPGGAFAAAIRPGRRAITIAVTPAAGLAGFAAPGDRVDVLLTQGIGKRRTGQTLLTNIAILGIDQRQSGDTVTDSLESAATPDLVTPDLVTLEVTPRQAEFLAIASDLGKLSLVLRGRGPDIATPTGRSWDSDVTGLPASLLATADDTPAPIAPTPTALPAASSATPAATPPSPASDGVIITYGLPPTADPAK
nr:Flp pilus assembly protein CpaB [Polymorphobacter sp.]